MQITMTFIIHSGMHLIEKNTFTYLERKFVLLYQELISTPW